jgi:23S rRNA (pseudouridine1915-N3)-methyltransferase
VSGAVRRRAEKGLALSRMTFTHEMCFLFLTEQLYRAFSILGGSGYHH